MVDMVDLEGAPRSAEKTLNEENSQAARCTRLPMSAVPQLSCERDCKDFARRRYLRNVLLSGMLLTRQRTRVYNITLWSLN